MWIWRIWTNLTIVLLLLITAETLLIVHGTADQFQRFGSAIVAISILLIPWTIKISREFNSAREHQEKRGVAMHHAVIWAHQTILAERATIVFQTALPIIGTLQWGYGDILFNAIKQA